MNQSEPLATQGDSKENGASRTKLYPLLAIGVALAFAANAWFFYRQGQENASNIGSESLPSAVVAWTRDEATQTPLPTAQPDSSVATDASQQPAATSNETAKTSDTATADKPATKRITKPKPANRTMLAKATRPATPAARMALERNVALLSHPKPAYPAPALRERQQGTVVVLAQIDVGGRVSEASIVRHSGSLTLNRAAINEVRRWKFEPALHNGQPIAANVQVPVNYRLTD